MDNRKTIKRNPAGDKWETLKNIAGWTALAAGFVGILLLIDYVVL